MALSIANRAYVIETGKINLSGDAKQLSSSPEVRKAYLGGS
jgi:branched-chain amino acid transport system ATP-binding protein